MEKVTQATQATQHTEGHATINMTTTLTEKTPTSSITNPSDTLVLGQVVKLDRSLPLIELADSRKIRCEHATDVVKNANERAVIGDMVEVRIPEGHDVGQIVQIHARKSQFIRKDPVDRARAQVLAANFDTVIIVTPTTSLNLSRLQRELVLAHQTGAKVAIIFTKIDLEPNANLIEQACAMAGAPVKTYRTSKNDETAKNAMLELIPTGTLAILIGKSGAGKSSLINSVCGSEVAATGEVRALDDKGRHTTVAREIIQIPGAGRIVDMPGVRGLGIWDGREGIASAFEDIDELATQCRFRDCSHTSEPNCAVLQAAQDGSLNPRRLEAFHTIKAELQNTDERREEARRAFNKKARTKKKR
jgi:ribosome biogenesis GTPase